MPAFHAPFRHSPVTTPTATTDLTPDQWDAAVDALGGGVLQSWRWGDFKARHGWEVERLWIGDETPRALAQILLRRHGPFRLAYLPRGPVLNGDPVEASALFRAIDTICQRRRAIALIVEPDRPLPGSGSDGLPGFVRGPRSFQPTRTVLVPLHEDDGLLAQMRRDTRANIRRAAREGVMIEHALPSPATVSRFFSLLTETGARNDFSIHTRDYYADVLATFGDDSMLAFARVGDIDAVGLIAVQQGTGATYLYGGSSTAHRVRGAAALLQYEAMRWARGRGCTHYDLWGLPAIDPPSDDLARGQVAATIGARWDGLYQFKTGFGGEIVCYPPALERRYRPGIAWLARRRYPRYRTAPLPGGPDTSQGSP